MSGIITPKFNVVMRHQRPLTTM